MIIPDKMAGANNTTLRTFLTPPVNDPYHLFLSFALLLFCTLQVLANAFFDTRQPTKPGLFFVKSSC